MNVEVDRDCHRVDIDNTFIRVSDVLDCLPGLFGITVITDDIITKNSLPAEWKDDNFVALTAGHTAGVNDNLIHMSGLDNMYIPKGSDFVSSPVLVSAMVGQSGALLATSSGTRIYIIKNFVVVCYYTNGKIVKIETLSKSKNNKIKIITKTVQDEPASLELIKFKLAIICKRLQPALDAATTSSEAVDALNSFVAGVTDLNYLIKIEKTKLSLSI